MDRRQELDNRIARIENVFIEKAQYNLGVREQKILLFLIANIDPRDNDFRVQTVPVKDLEAILKSDGKKWGGLYSEMNSFVKNISKKQILFPSGVSVDGDELPGVINWFSSVTPRLKDGIVCISFGFAPELKPFLLKLNEFARIDRSEISEMKSFYSIRLYQLFKATLQKQQKHRRIVTKIIGVDELRTLLNLEDKYPKFTELRRNVILPTYTEINELTSLHLDFEFLRNSKRHIQAIKFTIAYKDDVPKQLAFPEAVVKRSINDMSKTEILAKRSKFDFERFKKDYPAVYREKFKETKDVLGDRVKADHPAFLNSLQGLCSTWFVENT